MKRRTLMRKIALIMTAVLLMTGMTACGSSSDETESTSAAGTDSTTAETTAAADDTAAGDAAGSSGTQDTQTGSDTLVVYFSATGTTKGVAQKIAGITGADIYEIKAAQEYTDADLDWNDKNSRTTIEMNDPDVRPAIANDTVKLDSYTTVYIGYPIWWGDAPRMMSTFVEAHSFEGKTVIPFCTSGSSPIGRSGENLASQAGSGNWLAGGRLDANISESDIQDWINNMD
jgi:flavodoxin